MAGRGPAPQQQHQRERDTRRRQSDAVALVDDGELRGPELPASIAEPHAETLEWWTSWRTAPQAQLFEATDWEALKRAALLHDHVWKAATAPGGKPSAAAISELRLIEERFGATVVDRQRAKITINAAGPVAAVTSISSAPSARQSVADRLARK